jgi:hypothetical protein
VCHQDPWRRGRRPAGWTGRESPFRSWSFWLCFSVFRLRRKGHETGHRASTISGKGMLIALFLICIELGGFCPPPVSWHSTSLMSTSYASANALSTSSAHSSFGRVALVLDLAPSSWASLAQGKDSSSKVCNIVLSEFLDQIVIFAHQYHMLNRSNRLSLITMAGKWYVKPGAKREFAFLAQCASLTLY